MPSFLPQYPVTTIITTTMISPCPQGVKYLADTQTDFHCIYCITFYLGFPGGSDGKESAYNAGNLGSIPELGRSPGEGNGYPLQYSGLENSMNCMVHGVTKSRHSITIFSMPTTVMMGIEKSPVRCYTKCFKCIHPVNLHNSCE